MAKNNKAQKQSPHSTSNKIITDKISRLSYNGIISVNGNHMLAGENSDQDLETLNGHIRINGGNAKNGHSQNGHAKNGHSINGHNGSHRYVEINGFTPSNGHSLKSNINEPSNIEVVNIDNQLFNTGEISAKVKTPGKVKSAGEDKSQKLRKRKVVDMKQEIKMFLTSGEVISEVPPVIFAMNRIALIKKFIANGKMSSMTLKEKEYINFYKNLPDSDKTIELTSLNEIVGLKP